MNAMNDTWKQAFCHVFMVDGGPNYDASGFDVFCDQISIINLVACYNAYHGHHIMLLMVILNNGHIAACGIYQQHQEDKYWYGMWT